MTDHPAPYLPGPTPPARKRRRWATALLGVLVALSFCMVGALFIGAAGHAGKTGGTIVPAKATQVAAPLPSTSPTTEPTATATPKASDFVLTPTITDKACFGSAGCNVTFRMKVDYAGASSLDPDVTWLVVYEITGIDDSPQVGNFTVQGTDVNYDEQSVSTKSSKSKIKLRATSVQQN